MTAPSAAQLPPSAVPLPVIPPRGRRSTSIRRLGALAAVLLLASVATGCVTVDGADALVPSATRAAAAKALSRFVRVSNEANTKLDPQVTAQTETGALGDVDATTIKTNHLAHPEGDPSYPALALHDTHFLIPRQRGWSKWFVVNTGENRNNERWLLVFTHDSAAQPWRASYLFQIPAAQTPGFATDRRGYALPVPLTGSGLAVEPGRLSARYAAYLQHGDQGSGAVTSFTDGPYTSGARAYRRTGYPQNSSEVTAFADEAADPAHDGTVALRLKSGGAMVFFASQSQIKETTVRGPVNVPADAKPLLTGTPNTSVTRYYVAMQAVTDPSGGKAAFVSQVQGIVGARGQ